MNTKNAKRRVCVALGVLAMLAPAAYASEQPDHDANLAKAIADKVSERIGGLRDRFAPHEVPEFTAMPSNYELKLRETLEKPGMTRLAPEAEWQSPDAIDPMRTSSVRVVYPGYFSR